MASAQYKKLFRPSEIAERLESFDRERTLYRFRTRPPPVSFKHSVDNLGSVGDLLLTTRDEPMSDKGIEWTDPGKICPKVKSKLAELIGTMKDSCFSILCCA